MAARPGVRQIFPALTLLATIVLGGPSGPDLARAETFRQAMRRFVQDIAVQARRLSPGFVVIPQNGLELFSLGQDSSGPLATAYAAAVDGVGQESLYYGYPQDDQPTDPDATASLTGYLDLVKGAGLVPLVADYCSTHARMDDSYAKNAARGYVSFAAPHRNLDVIPDYPSRPYNAHQDDVRTLGQARNLLYLLSPSPEYATVDDYLADLAGTDYDLLIIDAFFADAMLTPGQVAGLKTKQNGGARLVVAYMSVGEAEVYRDYWQPAWQTTPPAWLDAPNPDWPDNYKVRYWMEGWRRIIYGSPGAYTERIVAAGFDGAYLDIIDAFEYYESRYGPEIPGPPTPGMLLLLDGSAPSP